MSPSAKTRLLGGFLVLLTLPWLIFGPDGTNDLNTLWDFLAGLFFGVGAVLLVTSKEFFKNRGNDDSR